MSAYSGQRTPTSTRGVSPGALSTAHSDHPAGQHVTGTTGSPPTQVPPLSRLQVGVQGSRAAQTPLAPPVFQQARYAHGPSVAAVPQFRPHGGPLGADLPRSGDRPHPGGRANVATSSSIRPSSSGRAKRGSDGGCLDFYVEAIANVVGSGRTIKKKIQHSGRR